MGFRERDYSPWFTTNSEYGKQVRENIERRLIGKAGSVTGQSTTDQTSCRHEDRENQRHVANKSRPSLSSLSSRSSLSSCSGSLTPKMTPAKSSRSPVRLTTSEKEYLKNQSSVHLSLPPFLGQRLPALQNASSMSGYTFRMQATDDSKRRSVERHYYKRRNPPSGLGKRYMLSECPRLWSNMGKLDRATTPAPSVDILKVEHEKPNERAEEDGEEGRKDEKMDDIKEESEKDR